MEKSPLKNYLSHAGIKIRRFSELSGVSRNTLHKVLRGNRTKPSVAEKISRATNFQVPKDVMAIKYVNLE